MLRKLLMTYSDSAFYAEQEYVLFKLNTLCLGSQNRILRKTTEKTGFSEAESFSDFLVPRQHLKSFKPDICDRRHLLYPIMY